MDALYIKWLITSLAWLYGTNLSKIDFLYLCASVNICMCYQYACTHVHNHIHPNKHPCTLQKQNIYTKANINYVKLPSDKVESI